MYQASITGNVVTHVPASGGIAFCAGFTDAPALFGNIATYHGADSSELRLSRGVTPDDAAIFVEEESCTDAEVVHIAEVVSYFAFQQHTAHKIRARTQAPANVPVVSETPVCANQATGPTAVCCSDMTDQVCVDCWGRQQQPPATATTCSQRSTLTFNSMNTVCCSGKAGCDTGAFPTRCSDDCAALWMPIWQDCGAMLTSMFAGSPDMAASIGPFSDTCETTFFGSGSGRCDDTYWQAGLQIITQVCPNPGSQVLQGAHLAGPFPSTCSPQCSAVFLPFFEECETKIAAENAYQANTDDARSYTNFAATCQAATPGGGH